jgi:hypothetical protein
MYKSILFTIAYLPTLILASDDVSANKQSGNPKQHSVQVVIANSKAESNPTVIKHVEYVRAGTNNKLNAKQVTPTLPLQKVKQVKKPDEIDKRTEIDRSNQNPREKLISKLKKLMGVDESTAPIDHLEYQMISMMREAVFSVMQEER